MPELLASAITRVPDIVAAPWPYLAFAALHLLLGQFGSAWIFRRRFGGSPLVLYEKGGADTPHMRTTRWITAPSLVWALSIILYAFSPTFRGSLAGAPLLDLSPLVGWTLGVIGLVGMMGAQASMGAAWRVGQDDADEAPQLVTGGIYQYSRNPVYLFSFLYVAAVTTWAPCPLAILSGLMVGSLMHELVLCEEAYLEEKLGDAYAEYCAQVPRYFLKTSRRPPQPPGPPTDDTTRTTGRGSFGMTRETLQELLRVRPAQVFGRIVLYFSAWFALGWGVLSTESLALRLALWVAMGFTITGLIQLAHETWHHNLFKRRWADEAFGIFLGWAVGLSHGAMRHDHLMHHRHNRTERDPDAYNAGHDTLGQRALFYSFVLCGLPLSLLYFNILYPLQHFAREDLPKHFLRVGLGATLHGVIWYGLWRAGWAAEAFMVWPAAILAASPFNGLKSIADHHNNVWKGDRYHTATTVRTNAFMRFWWCGLNYHLDHHLFPRVPGYNLHQLHAYTRATLEEHDAPVYDSYLKTMWDALVAGPMVVEDDVNLITIRSRRDRP